MRSCFLLMCPLTLLLLPSGIAKADTRWNGEVQVTAVTAGCTTGSQGDVVVGDYFQSTFRPSGLTGNDPDNSYLTFIAHYRAMIIRVAGTLAGTGAYSGTAVRTFGGLTFAGQRASVVLAPATVVDSTPTVRITGRVTNFMKITGCTVTFLGVYVPNL